jgi:hypothetical protein
MSRFDADNLPEGWALVRASDVCDINPRKHAADVLPADAPVHWERFGPIANHWVPRPRILHPYPNARFYAKHPR